MKSFDVQTIEINLPFDRVFDHIADAQKLPEWTTAFQSVSNGKAVISTPNGVTEITLTVLAARNQGTIDWIMTFPDGSVATAYSRVVSPDPERSIYSFILLAPPLPLEQLEGALEAQSDILREELTKLRAMLSRQ
jgi:hypothetical protein